MKPARGQAPILLSAALAAESSMNIPAGAARAVAGAVPAGPSQLLHFAA